MECTEPPNIAERLLKKGMETWKPLEESEGTDTNAETLFSSKEETDPEALLMILLKEYQFPEMYRMLVDKLVEADKKDELTLTLVDEVKAMMTDIDKRKDKVLEPFLKEHNKFLKGSLMKAENKLKDFLANWDLERLQKDWHKLMQEHSQPKKRSDGNDSAQKKKQAPKASYAEVAAPPVNGGRVPKQAPILKSTKEYNRKYTKFR